MSQFESPIPLSEIETVLTWVDTFNLSRPTKKINRDFSDAVLLAEILNVHYPKLVEMHNYPPRNSHSLKLNNWMTLNRKVLKKLKLNLCLNTMEQLANSSSGVIERVLVMVRDKIRRDEEANKASKDEGTNMSSGGSYYEACGDDEHILVVPVKTRINGVLETLQQKVVSYDTYCTLKEELKDAYSATEVLKQKVEHLDSLLKLKEERINELQNQLERKQTRRKEAEALQNTLSVPFETNLMSTDCLINSPMRTPSLKTLDTKVKGEESKIKIEEIKTKEEESNIKASESKTKADEANIRPPISKPKVDESSFKSIESKTKIDESNTRATESKTNIEDTKIKTVDSKPRVEENTIRLLDSKTKVEESRIPVLKSHSKPCLNDVHNALDSSISNRSLNITVTNMKYDIFKDTENINDKYELNTDHEEEFKDSVGDIITIEDTVQKEINNIINQKQPMYQSPDYV
ncbi:unnamed protein product [Arctia plantaginis]|uniref:Calponin-homology (CH) domain-containing protein n=1 Tax=Arctia plantaginis TaxID=874455 RepID=A0A8S1B781_ARCPL|nr:unnamed protein product [Arctia plantaginis]